MVRLKIENHDRGTNRATGKQQANLLEVRSAGIVLRSPAAASFRIRAAVADCSLLRVHHAASQLPDVQCEGRTNPLGRRQEWFDDNVPLVLGRLGEAAFVEGSCRHVWHDMAERISLGKTCRFVGFGAPESGGNRIDWRRRSAVAKRAQVSDVGLSDRFRLEAAVMDWQGSISHHAEDEQGDRQSPGWRGETNEGRRLLGNPQALAMVFLETARESD